MKIGYASKTVGIPGVPMKTTRLKNVTDEKLKELIQNNLESLDKILDYNIENDIKMFRISSDIIPFGSHEINQLKWWELFHDELEAIGQKALKHNMRLSMHPGQYTVLNSLDESVVERAVEDLRYHTRFLDALDLDSSHKIILHIGGVYGDKEAAMKRFIKNYEALDQRIKDRLIIENDDRQYTISEVLAISKAAEIPVVYDNLHHASNLDDSRSETEWILAAGETWNSKDGRQKIHYSQQDPDKRLGAHTPTIDLTVFSAFYEALPTKELDIMFEVKDKNLSALKGIHLIGDPKMKNLEDEWSRYKYLVLEHAPHVYKDIRELLKDKTGYPILPFYTLIDQALATPISPGNAVNAAQHIWGYVNDVADDQTTRTFENKIQSVAGGTSTKSLKRLLWKLVQKQDQQYLKKALYFMELH
jgi:UV DNA damage endonuclease